jgi:hypothetical protein
MADAVLWLRRLVAYLSPRFALRSVHVIIPCDTVVDKVALGQVSVQVLLLSLSIIPPGLRAHRHMGDEQ